MKTCTNPKCNATGIPDDAKFCPKCGEPLSQLSFTQKEKYDSLQKERESLSERHKSLIAFHNARKQLYERLLKDDRYKAAIKDSRNIIKHNKEVEKKRIEHGCTPAIIMVIIMLVVITIGALGISGVLMVITSKDGYLRTNQVSDWVWVCIGLLTFMFLIVIAKISFIIAEKIMNGIIEKDNKHIDESLVSYENEFTQTHLTPFIQEHEVEYDIIHMSIYDEIYEPDKVTQAILQKIEEIETRIKELDMEMQLLTKV